jgi:hypothetical protein
VHGSNPPFRLGALDALDLARILGEMSDDHRNPDLNAFESTVDRKRRVAAVGGRGGGCSDVVGGATVGSTPCVFEFFSRLELEAPS